MQVRLSHWVSSFLTSSLLPESQAELRFLESSYFQQGIKSRSFCAPSKRCRILLPQIIYTWLPQDCTKNKTKTKTPACEEAAHNIRSHILACFTKLLSLQYLPSSQCKLFTHLGKPVRYPRYNRGQKCLPQHSSIPSSIVTGSCQNKMRVYGFIGFLLRWVSIMGPHWDTPSTPPEENTTQEWQNSWVFSGGGSFLLFYNYNL